MKTFLTFIQFKKNLIFTLCALIAIIIISIYCYKLTLYTSTDNARIKIANIQIAAEVSGYVKKINYENNTPVNLNDIILEIEQEPYNFANEKAKADLDFNKSEYERILKLQKGSYISEEKLNTMKHAYEIAIVNAKKAAYTLAQTNVTAKSTGILTNFDFKVGDFITKGTPLFNIINKTDLWIEANFKEADITYIQAGQPAEIKIDTFQDITWHAHVVSIAPAVGSEFSLLPAQNSSGNWIKVAQRITVRLRFDQNQDLSKLSSGMSATVKIKIH